MTMRIPVQPTYDDQHMTNLMDKSRTPATPHSKHPVTLHLKGRSWKPEQQHLAKQKE